MAATIARATLIVACCSLVYVFGSIGTGYLAAQNGRDHHVDIRYGAFGVEPACRPGTIGRVDLNGLTWCDPRDVRP